MKELEPNQIKVGMNVTSLNLNSLSGHCFEVLAVDLPFIALKWLDIDLSASTSVDIETCKLKKLSKQYVRAMCQNNKVCQRCGSKA